MRSSRPPVRSIVSAAGIGVTIRCLQIGSPPPEPAPVGTWLAPMVTVPVNG